MKRLLSLLIMSMLLVLLNACGWQGVPQVKTSSPNSIPNQNAATGIPATYTVLPGDTLYSIAFRYELAIDDIARWNAIGPPYTIYPEQQLRLQSRFGQQAVSATNRDDASKVFPDAGLSTKPLKSPATASSAAKPIPPENTVAKPEPATVSADKPIVRVPSDNTLKTQPLITTASTEASTASKPVPKTVPKLVVASTPKKPNVVTASNAGVQWTWPVAGGRLSRRFVAGDQSRQGIDIGGNAGQPVLSAADGEVVYSGTGLLGFSELIIVKHNDTLLSAYAHNRRRLVKEGDTVRAGQQIAELGRSPRGENEVHVQIRNKGKPQDPLKYLPDQ